MPKELSGGEQQRVALARAIVRQPKVALMDEPLSNLDAPLRAQMRTMLRRVHREIGGTTVYVTHDQTEALSLGDTMGVMNEGALLQYDTPDQIYSHPSNLFVAHFVGVLPSNLVDVNLVTEGIARFLVGKGFRYPLSESISRSVRDGVGFGELVLSIRPEDTKIAWTPSSEGSLEAEVNLVERMGSSNSVVVTAGGETMKVLVSSEVKLKEGDRVWLDLPPDKIHVFEKRSGRVIP
jgi:ABC-type sugar transport system ATPase subunit